MSQDWARLFPAAGFRWQMGLRSGDARVFFAPTQRGGEILAERRQLLDEAPGDYACLLDSGQPLLEEMHRHVCAIGGQDPSDCSLDGIGRNLEPDFVLLLPSSAGPAIVGGVVCFPSSWSLPEKLGRTLNETHAPVPDLNPQLAERIRTALDRLPADGAWERDNWGLSRDDARNHHPRQARRRLDGTVEPEEVWLRVERQILCRLPETKGILFGIRLEITPWLEVVQTEEASLGLRRALETMLPEIAEYKGLSRVKDRILSWLTK